MTPFYFASRTAWNVTPNELSRRLEEHRRSGQPLFDLTQSNPTRCEFNYPPQPILDSFAQTASLSYAPLPKGLLSARQAVARSIEWHTQKPFDPEQIFLTAGTSEAYSFLFRLLAEPGDCVLVPRPSYPLFDFLAQLNDVHLDYYTLAYHDGWHPDFSSIEQNLKANTRALLVVNPNNPTGSGMSLSEQERLAALCRAHPLALISDEVFLDFGFEKGASPAEKHRLHSLAGNSQALTFCLNGISKMLGLPQMKLAWIAASGPLHWLEPALTRLEVIADTYLSVGTPVQQALPRWLEEVRKKIQPQILRRIQSNLAFLDERAAQTRGLCQRLKADGGWSAVLSIPRTRREEDWVLRWLEWDSVLVHPGYFFDFDQEGYIVVSLLPPERIFREGIERVLSRIEKELR